MFIGVNQHSYSILVVRNSCDTPPKTKEDRLVSAKSDQSLHGFGLKSVAKTLKKYHGDFAWDYDAEGRLFTITAMMENR